VKEGLRKLVLDFLIKSIDEYSLMPYEMGKDSLLQAARNLKSNF